jgi:hypothetical protein
MAAFQKSYRNIEEFEREEIRPSFRIGFSLEDLVQEAEFEGELLFDQQEEEFALDRVEDEEDDEDDDDDRDGATVQAGPAVRRRDDNGGATLWGADD